jgi:transcriptional regulator with XRE-family HTH domain
MGKRMAIKSDIRVRIGSYLRQQRKARGITQIELANRLGTSQNMISFIETGKLSIQLDKVPDFCRVLKIRPVDLISIFQEATR